MSMISRFTATAALGACAWVGSAAPAGRTAERTPVLLELFTSEGCSSCPSADRLLQSLDAKQPIGGADLIVLSEHVDYWDGLGWKDPFASHQYTERQNEYGRHFRLDSVYTPQIVIDGKAQLVGSDGSGIQAAVEKTIDRPKIAVNLSNLKRGTGDVKLRIETGEVSAKSNAAVFVAVAENQMESKVARGENGGRLLKHVAVTRVLSRVGAVARGTGFSNDVTVPTPAGIGAGGLRVVVFIQDLSSGQILGVSSGKV